MKKNVLFSALLMFGASVFAQNTIDNPFFEKVNFRGAFGTTDWTAGWSNFDPQNTLYPATQHTIEAGNITSKLSLGSPFKAPSSFANPSLANSFFEPVDYIGAFGQTDWTAGWANFDPQNTIYPATTITVNAGDITTNTTWTKNNVYLLNGFVYVKDGATLTIEAGTVIRGDKTNKGSIIVERGGKLVANGTAAEPIVFTSNQNAGSRTYGDWGGIILLGKAPTNKVNPTIEGGVGTGLSAQYGGTDAEDNSGSLQYVRIEFCGIAYATDNEINGLTMGGVGSGTTLDYIQVSYAGDDSFEWFGGTVNAKHLIAFRGWDDDFDTDFGYSGMVQFAVSLRDPDIADVSSSNCFESDNDGTGTSATPFTSAVFSNVSSFGPKVTASTTIHPKYASAMHIRRSSKIQIFNSVFAGWPKGLLVDGTSSQNAATAGDLKVQNTIMSGMGVDYAVGSSGQTWDVAAANAWYNTVAFNNSTYADNTSLLVNNPFNLTSPDFKPFNSYKLNGFVYVKDGGILTVNPGVVVRGDKTNKGSIIVERGGKLIANGTATQPIVFTSNQDAGSRTYGDWGGIILLGKAPTNKVNPTIEGGVGTGLSAQYGGTDATDNSGSLQYVRLEFPGVAYATDNEINGLTMGGVGSGTTLDYIQVSYCGDDSFEWFGGTVNAKHLIAFRGWDDDFDTDFGYSGMVQFAVSLRDPDIADVSSSNCFESDNDGTGTSATPFTSAVFSNVSSFGPKVTASTTVHPKYASAMHIRRSSKLQIFNSVFAGWPKGLLVDGTSSQNAATAGDLKVQNTVMSGMGANFAVGTSGQTWDVTAAGNWYNNIAFRNKTEVNNTDLKYADPFNLTAPNFLPTATSKMLAQSYWQFTPTEGLQYYAPMVFTAYANGSQVTAPGSMLMVYKNNECLGSQEITPGSNDFMITVGSNESFNPDMDIKLYDASTRTMYHLPTVVHFDAEGTVGTPDSPVRLDATGSLSISLLTGANKYNWISFNVLPEENNVGNVLNYSATNGDFISNGTETSFYYDGVWYGLESTGLLKNKMYVLFTKATSPGSITITNQPLVKNEPISFIAGYNWFGYSLMNSYDIRTALAGITATINDNVVTQGKTAWYTAGGWGALTMVPGKGYIFKSATASTFSFPTNNALTTTKSAKISNDDNFVWTPENGQRYAMPVLAQVYKNGELYQPEGMQMGIFKDGKCFGVGSLDENAFNVTVGSNLESQSGMKCILFDPTTSQTYEVEEAIDFKSLESVGNITNPAVFTIKESVIEPNQMSEQFSVYTNQSSIVFTISSSKADDASVMMYDLQGKIVKSLFNGNIDGVQTIEVERGNLKDGLYLIKASVGNKQYTEKVILK